MVELLKNLFRYFLKLKTYTLNNSEHKYTSLISICMVFDTQISIKDFGDSDNPDTIYFKVCHSSAFQTISVRSVYINIINYSGSILANLNNTMQTIEHATKKPHPYSNVNKIY